MYVGCTDYLVSVIIRRLLLTNMVHCMLIPIMSWYYLDELCDDLCDELCMLNYEMNYVMN